MPQPLARITGVLIGTALLLFFTFLLPVEAQKLEIRTSTPPPQEEYNQNWNSHIDNQAYLEKRSRQAAAQSTPPVIIIERHNEQRYPHSDCDSRSCNSWEVEYHSPGYSFSYRENYHLNHFPPAYIIPDPHRRKIRALEQNDRRKPVRPW